MKHTEVLIATLAVLVALTCSNQSTQAQSIWASAQTDIKFYKNFSGYVEAEYRTQNRLDGSARWGGAFGLEYKPIKYLKTTIGYNFLYDRSEDEITKKGHLIPAYWLPRHRFNVALTGSYAWDFGLKISLRERYQYTFSKSKEVSKLDKDTGEQLIDPVTGEENLELIKAKQKHQLRSRLQLDYEIPNIRLEPFLSCELYNSLSAGFAIDKVRYSTGLSYPITKMHSIKLYYLFEDFMKAGKRDSHVIGIGYKLKIRPKKK